MAPTSILNHLLHIYHLKIDEVREYFAQLKYEMVPDSVPTFQIYAGKELNQDGIYSILIKNSQITMCKFNTGKDIGYEAILTHAIEHHGFIICPEEGDNVVKVLKGNEMQLMVFYGPIYGITVLKAPLDTGKVIEVTVVPPPPLN